ncbi:uncharacterized protein LOC129177075 [Dunckerocampus dactyliophorus]|uniref:uncharacterized protein LOC129177075 n=1 Tax=Dunckerocampus dactyliophorus TaxID=161453 RepID=UPI0024065E8F|nr:uncharacterized protein LOC129177075 [Dunckerocampus dactyliophorus]
MTSSSPSAGRQRDSQEEMFGAYKAQEEEEDEEEDRQFGMFLLFIRTSPLPLLLLVLPLARCVAAMTGPRRLTCGQEVAHVLVRNLWTQSQLLIQRLPEEKRQSKRWRLLPNFCTGCPERAIGWLEVRQMIDIYQRRVFDNELVVELLPLHYRDLLHRLQRTLQGCVSSCARARARSARVTERKRREEGVMKAVTEFTFILTWMNELMHRTEADLKRQTLVSSPNLLISPAMSARRLCLLVLVGTLAASADYSGPHPDIRQTLESISDVLELRKPDVSGVQPFKGVIRSISACQSLEAFQVLNATLSVYVRIFHSILRRTSSLLDVAPPPKRAQLEQNLIKLQHKTKQLREHLQRRAARCAHDTLDTLAAIKMDDIMVQKGALAQFLEVYRMAFLIGSRNLVLPSEVTPPL